MMVEKQEVCGRSYNFTVAEVLNSTREQRQTQARLLYAPTIVYSRVKREESPGTLLGA